MNSPTIRLMADGDWSAVNNIYQQGIDTGHTTFDPAPPARDTFESNRIPELSFVATDDNHNVVGWVVAYRVSARQVYRGVVEHSIYIAEAARNQGVGTALLRQLVTESETAGYWTIQSVIFPENTGTIRLHEAFGFRIVGRRERIAYMGFGEFAGRWRDTYLIERRSTLVSTDGHHSPGPAAHS